MTENRANNPSKRPVPEVEVEDENRIDWARKQKSKRQAELEPSDDLPTDEDLAPIILKDGPKSHSRKKRRQLVYDEERDTVIVKRKRRRQAERPRLMTGAWYDWDDEP